MLLPRLSGLTMRSKWHGRPALRIPCSTTQLKTASEPSVTKLASAAPCHDHRGIIHAHNPRFKTAAPICVAVRYHCEAEAVIVVPEA